MKLTYRLVPSPPGWTAECLDTEAAGEGATVEDAVASLRDVLEERLFRPDAVAPPSRPDTPEIELVRVD